MAKKIIELPKLPYGQGTYSWDNPNHTVIKFRKPLEYNGIKKYETAKGKTISECNANMKEKENKFIEECQFRILNNPNNKSLTFAKSSFNWMVTFKISILKGASYDTIESTYNNQVLTAPFANYQTEIITDVDIQKHLETLKEKEYSRSIIKKAYSFFNQFFKYYYRKNPYNNPMISVSIPEYKNDIILDNDGNIDSKNKVDVEQEYIILEDKEIEEFTVIATEEIKTGIQGYKHGWGLVFMMWTFLRFGEALALQWRDFNFDDKTVLVYKSYSRIRIRDENDTSGKNYRWSLSTVKTKSGIRKFLLCDQAINAILEYKKILNPRSDNDFIFSTSSGLPISNSNLNTTLKKILNRAGIYKHVTVHGLRHTGISYFIRHNVDKDIVSKMAGHSNVIITDKVYYTIIDDQLKSEVDKINQLLKNKEGT